MRVKLIRSRRRRSAVSLVEMVVTITLGSSLMLSAVTVVHRAMDYRQQTQQRVEHQRVIDRELLVVRRSVSEAIAVECPTESELQIKLEGDETIVYRIEGGLLTRQRTRGDAVIQTHSVTLDSRQRLTFQVDELGRQVSVRLKRFPLGKNLEPIVERQVLAIVGVLATRLESGEQS